MAKVLNYFVYMTYDFHGQWDMDNKWSSIGCPMGNCLQLHINKTTTEASLVMLTKAGVPSNKILLGLASYSRSLRMSKHDCTRPMCTYTGSNTKSNAYKGRCTNTAGYISHTEIREITVIVTSPTSSSSWTTPPRVTYSSTVQRKVPITSLI